MFGRKSKPCKAFKYGCLAPLDESVITKEIYLKNQYWNKLVEIERTHQEKTKPLLWVPGDDEAEQLEARIDAMTEDKTIKQSAIKEAKKALKALWAENKKARKIIAEENRTDLDEAEALRVKAQKEARKASGLYWGNYGDIDMAYSTARIQAMKKGEQLQFHRHDGTGKISVRFQQGLPVTSLFREGSNNLIQIKPVDPGAWTHPVRAERRRLTRTTVKIRVRSGENNQPVWAELKMVLHRPLPEGGSIRSASLIRERVGRRHRYSLVIIVAFSDAHNAEREHAGSMAMATRPAAGINIGWRLKDEGLRVAYCVDENAASEELVLDKEIVSQFKKIDDLKSIRDRHFNDMRDKLKVFLSENSHPDWLKEATEMLHAWKSVRRLAGVAYKWRENRFEGDDMFVGIMEGWLKKENHLYDWEANLRDQLARRRRELYRLFAVKVAEKYGRVFIEEFQLTDVARKPRNGLKKALPPDRFRVIAAISTLRIAIETALNSRGISLVRSNAEKISKECHVCGHTEKWRASASIERTCPKCMSIWDQDFNAATLNLRRGLCAAG